MKSKSGKGIQSTIKRHRNHFFSIGEKEYDCVEEFYKDGCTFWRGRTRQGEEQVVQVLPWPRKEQIGAQLKNST